MRVLFASIAVSGLICAAPAGAEPIGESYSESISYADLNLASASGLAAFKARVEARADSVCTGASDSPLQQSMQARECRAHFVKSAEQQLQLAIAPVGGAILAAR